MKTTAPKPNSELPAVSVELLGKPIHAVRDNLQHILQASCHTLSNALQSWLKTNQIDVKLECIDLHTLRLSDIDKNATTTLRHQDGGLAYMTIDAPMLVKLADRFYGAAIERKTPTLTSSDVRLQERIAKLVAAWIAPDDMWSPCEVELGQGMGLRSVFEIHFGDTVGTLSLDIEGNLIQTLIEQLGLHRTQDLSASFAQSLTATPVRLNVLLSKKTLPLSDVLSLAPNDILPIELLATVPVSIGNQQLFTGRVAEQDGQLVLILNHE
ncbi:flagellar motor switch protein FliM [Enterovibrio norvegicus FF-33]|uniref:FliM/FliN family flagellar motor switch protein n=1 Tax=Enterovibrio norvegicus TaxID=188144 RepID=UPI0002FB0F43|nr:flagellar motor switch protein FliM [Enterovibrio norvegicus]OEE70342.1 flagellar motor switch protein FliM [Enterovibrio norvegicus FF-33]